MKRTRILGFVLVVILSMISAGCDSVLMDAVMNKIALEETVQPTAGGAAGPDPDKDLDIVETLAGSVTISWVAGADDRTDASQLSYQIVYSAENNIGTEEEVEANGTACSDWLVGVTTGTATGLTILTPYYFNVVVRDRAGNKDVYKPTPTPTWTLDDTTAPTPGDEGVVTISNVAEESFSVSWTGATDNYTSDPDLEYLIYISESDDIGTVATAEENGIPIGDYSSKLTSATVTGLTDFVLYYVNVLVRDGRNNKAAYSTASKTTVKIPRIYWTEPLAGRIRRAPLDDSEDGENYLSLGASSMPMVIDIDIDGRRAYWSDVGTSQNISAANLDGTNLTTVISSHIASPYGIAVDPDSEMLYWSDETYDEIYAAPVSTTNGDASDFVILDSVDGVNNPGGVFLDLVNSKLYWLQNGAGGSLWRADLDGSNPTQVYTTVVTMPHDLYVDPELSRVYYTDEDTDSSPGPIVARVGTGGSGFQTIVDTNVTLPYGIAVSGNYLYWADYSTQKLHSAPVTTTDGDALDYDFTSVMLTSNPLGIAIDD